MTRYMWMIHTADEDAEETLGDVYFSLHGLDANTRELKLPKRDFLPGTVESGTIEVRGDLGEVQTGMLRTENTERSSWTPDWVKVICLSDAREWSAQGGACDEDGTCPLLRFEKTAEPQALQKRQELPLPELGENNPDNTDPEQADAQDAKSVVRTYEVFGKYKGRVVPLAEILKIRAGVKHLTAGARILITAEDSEGFGLAGEPGLWDELYPSVSPAVYGLEPDRAVMASDGSRGWVMDAHTLAMIFGADWRRVVYGK